jgi:hypothetical protein
VPGPDAAGASVAFDNRTRTWQEQSNASQTWLRFQLPAPLLPSEIEQATLTLNISAPLRSVKLSTGRPTGMAHLARRSDPVGTFSYRIDQPEALQLDATGGLHVLLNVGELELKSDRAAEAGFLEKRWQVNSLDIDVRVRTLAREAE